MRPFIFIVAPRTLSPGPTSSGTLSPVIVLVSIDARPSTTTPSAANFSPGRTTIKSSIRTTLAGIVFSTPSRITTASRAPRVSNARKASPALNFARVSRKRPIKIKAVIEAATSKYTWLDALDIAAIPTISESPASPHTNAHTDHAVAAVTPIEINVSILAAPWRIFVKAAR